MRKLGYILLVMCALECSSCDDFLDVKPVGQMIPTEVTQFENLLNNTTTLDYFMLIITEVVSMLTWAITYRLVKIMQNISLRLLIPTWIY